MTDLEQLEQLERRMEAAWRGLTAEELRGNIPAAERAYDRYLAALDEYMREVAQQQLRASARRPLPDGNGNGSVRQECETMSKLFNGSRAETDGFRYLIRRDEKAHTECLFTGPIAPDEWCRRPRAELVRLRNDEARTLGWPYTFRIAEVCLLR